MLEFGCAGGNGLLNLEYHARKTRAATGTEVSVFGFDTGRGLPHPRDYRDLPYHWKGGYYEMDRVALERRLEEAQLVIGDVADTVQFFVRDYQPPTIGAMMFDLDYYSSTSDAFGIFDVSRENMLPRVFLYLDDVLGNERSAYTHYTGVLGAVRDFNASHPDQKICPLQDFVAKGLAECMRHVYVYHDFAHRDYSRFLGAPVEQIPLSAR